MNAEFQIACKPWRSRIPPVKILAIRLQALGDTVITLPYLQYLKRQNPELKIHLMTRKEVCSIAENTALFEKVIVIGGKRNVKLQLILVLLKLPYLWWQGYDVVLDLQKNIISVMVRKLLAAKAWSEFDKYSAHSAGDRTRRTIEAIGLWKVELDTHFNIGVNVESLLLNNGWREDQSIVALNPAGSFPSRSWPLENYVSFARLWSEQINPDTQFVLLLLPSQREKGDYISGMLKDKCINLTGKANQIEAFAVLRRCSFLLSEDSGLMHMGWVQGIPTMALFSSSNKIWSAPQGKWSACLDSSDLECGPCSFFNCKFGDNRCLTRYTPDFVISKTKQLLEKCITR